MHGAICVLFGYNKISRGRQWERLGECKFAPNPYPFRPTPTIRVTRYGSEASVKRHIHFMVLLVYGLLALSACGGQVVAPPADLPVGITWQWVSLSQGQGTAQPAVPDPQQYLLL